MQRKGYRVKGEIATPVLVQPESSESAPTTPATSTTPNTTAVKEEEISPPTSVPPDSSTPTVTPVDVDADSDADDAAPISPTPPPISTSNTTTAADASEENGKGPILEGTADDKKNTLTSASRHSVRDMQKLFNKDKPAEHAPPKPAWMTKLSSHQKHNDPSTNTGPPGGVSTAPADPPVPADLPVPVDPAVPAAPPTSVTNESEHSVRSSSSRLSSKIHALSVLKQKGAQPTEPIPGPPNTDTPPPPNMAATLSTGRADLLDTMDTSDNDDDVFEDGDGERTSEEELSTDNEEEVESESVSEEEIVEEIEETVEEEPNTPSDMVQQAPAMVPSSLNSPPATTQSSPVQSQAPANEPQKVQSRVQEAPAVVTPPVKPPSNDSPPAAPSSPIQSWNPQKEQMNFLSTEKNDANIGAPLYEKEHSIFYPTEPDTFAPPRPSGAPVKERSPPPPPPPPVLPKQPSMALSTLPKPPSQSNVQPPIDEEDEENDDWMVPHRNEDDSSWVNPSHPVQPERKQLLTEELKKKSVDLFPEDGKPPHRLANIAEDSKFNDLVYDAKVGLIVGEHSKNDGQSISETSFSVDSKMDRSAQILESSVPRKENSDVWALPRNEEMTYRAVGKLDSHKDGKDYRFSYITQQHTHSTSSYADVVRERYFPKEDNEYWAAPARESTPELPIHISRSGEFKHGPAKDDETWMPPEIDPNAKATPIDKQKYYAPSIAEEKYAESRSVVTEGSDWLGKNTGARSIRIDFAGSVNEGASENSFEWNPSREGSETAAELSSIHTPEPEALHAVKNVRAGLPSPPSDDDTESSAGDDDKDDDFATNPVAAMPRPPSPSTSRQGQSIEAAPQEAGSQVKNPDLYSPSGRKRNIQFSPSGRLKFDMTPSMIVIGDNEEGEQTRRISLADSQKKRQCCLFLCFFLIMVPAAVACIIIFVVGPNMQGDKAPSNPIPSPSTPAPTSNIITTPAPTPMTDPTGSVPSASTPPVDDEVLLEFLARRSTDGGAALRDPTSPQYAAMQWLKSENNQGIYADAVFFQRYSLATLYYSTGGGQWTSSTAWLTNATECDWFTSSTLTKICNSEGKLVELNLRGNNLMGSIPPELNLLSNSLLTLQLGNNQLTGQMTPFLSELSSLETLHLAQNKLDGTIPTTFGSLSRLRALYLHSNLLASTLSPHLGNLTSVLEIDLGANELTGTLPTELGRMTTLQSLALHDNRLTGSIPPELINLTNLRILYLDSNSLGPFLPDAICNSMQLDEFWTDCEEIGGCDCCTRCCTDGETCGS